MLRKLIIAHASCQINAPRPDPTGFVLFKADLRSIPLWLSNNSATGNWISSDIALVAENRAFMVPWMKQHARFIVPELAGDPNQNCVQALDIQKVSAGSLLNSYLLPLPSMSSSSNWNSYRLLIAAVSSFCESRDNWNTVQTTLSQNQIVVDGNRSLRRAGELFDHEDQIFLSAFRGQEESKFVHGALKGFRRFWLKAGLRHRQNGLLDPADYLKCLQSLSQRLSTEIIDSDANLAADIRIVLSPLTTPSSSIHNFTRNDWPTISRERVFASQSSVDAEPEYRRVPMGVIAADRPLLALSEVISYSYVAICWSQIPFTVHAPTAEVLSFIQGNGKPSVGMVWRHLGHLADMAQHLTQSQTSGFLHDLHCTYAYLQDHVDETRAYFNLQRKALWLNISSSEGEQAILTDVRSSWNEIGDLVLSSSCDAGRIKAVRPSLMRYEKLLRALGCKSITYPTVTRPVLHHGHSISASLRTLRAENKLLDITYCTEGKEIQAHRVVLAAVSEKCARQWSGNFPVEDKITYDEDGDPDSFLSYHTLSTMINYAYECAIDWSEMEASDDDDAEAREDKLHMLLDLHKGAQYWLIPALMSQVEDKILVAGKMFINIENVVVIQQRAEYVGAKAVEKMCSQFIHENKDAVERANSASVE